MLRVAACVEGVYGPLCRLLPASQCNPLGAVSTGMPALWDGAVVGRSMGSVGRSVGWHRRGTTQVADNVIYPGTPEYLQYVDTAAGRYATRLYSAQFEMEEVWREGWEKNKEDAMSYSLRLAPGAESAATAA